MPHSQKKRLSAALDLSPRHVRRLKRAPIQAALPTFEQPVSDSDIDLWCDRIAPHVSQDRRATYAKHYNIPEKIRRAKNSGQWPPTPNRA
jgi:hypothetical protein